jgi:hypothetical protein
MFTAISKGKSSVRSLVRLIDPFKKLGNNLMESNLKLSTLSDQ